MRVQSFRFEVAQLIGGERGETRVADQIYGCDTKLHDHPPGEKTKTHYARFDSFVQTHWRGAAGRTFPFVLYAQSSIKEFTDGNEQPSTNWHSLAGDSQSSTLQVAGWNIAFWRVHCA